MKFYNGCHFKTVLPAMISTVNHLEGGGGGGERRGKRLSTLAVRLKSLECRQWNGSAQ